MTTKIIGIKNFRKSITSIWKESREKKTKYIVMFHSTPIFEVTPINEEELILNNLKNEIQQARDQVKRGEVYTSDEVYKKLGL